MKTQDYEKAMNLAKSLPTHINGKLQETYVFFNEENRAFQKIMFAEKANPVTVFEAMKPKYHRATRFYLKVIPSYREDGSLKKQSEWDKKLFFHKAWQRKDTEVTGVTFDVVGAKRKTTHLPAGVLITNIEFTV
jgi:hypothetical protein